MQMSNLPAELQKISNCPSHSRPTLEFNLMHYNLKGNINYCLNISLSCIGCYSAGTGNWYNSETNLQTSK